MSSFRRSSALAVVCGLLLAGCGAGADTTATSAEPTVTPRSDRPSSAEASPSTQGKPSGDGKGTKSPREKDKKDSGDDAGPSREPSTTPTEEKSGGKGGSDTGGTDQKDSETSKKSEDSTKSERSEESEKAEASEDSEGTEEPTEWTPQTLISTELSPSGYAVANRESELKRPSLTDPCGQRELASEKRRAERELMWWTPDGTTETAPLISVDAISYTEGAADDALNEIRDQVRSCGERSFDDGSTLRLSLDDTDGLMPDSAVVRMEVVTGTTTSARAVYQRVGDIVVAMWTMFDTTDASADEEADELVMALAHDYAAHAQSGP